MLFCTVNWDQEEWLFLQHMNALQWQGADEIRQAHMDHTVCWGKQKKKIWSLSLVCLGINVFLIWSACPWAWQQNVLGRELLKRLIIYIISGYFPTLLDAVIPQGNLSAPSNTKLLSVFCLDIFAVGAERSLEVTSWSLEPWCLIVGIALNPSWSATCIRVSKGARNCPYPSGLTCCSDFLRNLDAPIHISLLTPLPPSLSLFIYLYFF